MVHEAKLTIISFSVIWHEKMNFLWSIAQKYSYLTKHKINKLNKSFTIFYEKEEGGNLGCGIFVGKDDP